MCSEANRPSNDVTLLLVKLAVEHIEHSEIINSAEPKRVGYSVAYSARDRFGA